MLIHVYKKISLLLLILSSLILTVFNICKYMKKKENEKKKCSAARVEPATQRLVGKKLNHCAREELKIV